MQAVLSCAVMYWSLVAALSWDDIDGDFLAWRYAPMFRLRISFRLGFSLASLVRLSDGRNFCRQILSNDTSQTTHHSFNHQ